MLRQFTVSLFALSLVGCAATGVPYSSDPQQKLADARMLFLQHDRPLPAGPMILQAIEILETQDQPLQLAEAYRTYGLFLNSAAVERYRSTYQNIGFNHASISFEQRHQGAIEYYSKAAEILQQQDQLDYLSNTYLNIGISYSHQQQVDKACAMYVKSLATHRLFQQQNPDHEIAMPEPFSSYEQYIQHQMTVNKCPPSAITAAKFSNND